MEEADTTETIQTDDDLAIPEQEVGTFLGMNYNFGLQGKKIEPKA